MGGLLPYVGQPLDPSAMRRAMATGGAAGPAALFSPRQHAAANPPGRDYSLTPSPLAAFEAKLNDPVFRAMFGEQGSLAAAATAGRLASDSERNMLAPFQDNQALQVEALKQQGWTQQRQQEASQFAKDMAMREREFGLKEDDAQFNRGLLEKLGLGGEAVPTGGPPNPITGPVTRAAEVPEAQQELADIANPPNALSGLLINTAKLANTAKLGASFGAGFRDGPGTVADRIVQRLENETSPGKRAALEQAVRALYKRDPNLQAFVVEEYARILQGRKPLSPNSKKLIDLTFGRP